VTEPRRSRVQQFRIAESVAGELRARILASDGDYGFPTQDQLVTEFGVSYPSIREALRILETEGLVTVRRGKVGGAEVHRPDEISAAYHLGLALEARKVTLGDLAGALQLIEPMCVAECATRPDRADTVVPALAANLDISAALVGDGVAFTKAARQFHDMFVVFNPNATIRHVAGSLVALWSAQEQTWAEVMARRGEYPSKDDATSAVRAHQRILDEIAGGNPAEAARIARAHLAATQKLVLHRFEDGVVTVSSSWARQITQVGGAALIARREP
jgi:GntR family transcriptional regulator, transcriptional repressor for pyruvate dehydrogenase complex